jgi:hypothetical protein
MKIDTTGIQFQMYNDIGWIPAKYFKESMSDQKWIFPQDIWIKGEHWVLKNGASENAHYERSEK